MRLLGKQQQDYLHPEKNYCLITGRSKSSPDVPPGRREQHLLLTSQRVAISVASCTETKNVSLWQCISCNKRIYWNRGNLGREDSCAIWDHLFIPSADAFLLLLPFFLRCLSQGMGVGENKGEPHGCTIVQRGRREERKKGNSSACCDLSIITTFWL